MKKKLLYTVLFSVIILISGMVDTARGQNRELFSIGDDPEVSLVEIGSRIYTDFAGKQVDEPMFAVRIGDLAVAENEAAYWDRAYGNNALNATIYMRAEKGKNEKWLAKTFYRPSNDEEAIKFREDPLSFYEEKILMKNSLPSPFGSLNSDDLSKADFLIVYLTGGIKIYLVYGATFEEAETFTEKIDFWLRALPL